MPNELTKAGTSLPVLREALGFQLPCRPTPPRSSGEQRRDSHGPKMAPKLVVRRPNQAQCTEYGAWVADERPLRLESINSYAPACFSMERLPTTEFGLGMYIGMYLYIRGVILRKKPFLWGRDTSATTSSATRLCMLCCTLLLQGR